MSKGMTRICPTCGEKIKGITTGWTLSDWETNGHQIATIGTSHNAPEHLANTVRFQIASNLAAYDLDYDAELNLGWMGTAWIQCPQARDKITSVTFPR